MNTSNRVLITGANGQLGRELYKLIPNAIAADIDVLDITNQSAIDDFVLNHGIKVIVNCAAYTAVDKAEDEEEKELCFKLNAIAPEYLARTPCQLIHISTDYVFNGQGYRPYIESDVAQPINHYGATKLDGEQRVLACDSSAVIVRTSWLYSSHGNNFVKTMIRLGSNQDLVRVICDQVGTPTFAGDLAKAILSIMQKLDEKGADHSLGGIYHYSNEGVCSWYDFAHEIMRLKGLSCEVKPILTSEYPTKAKRPFYSVLDKSKIKSRFNINIPHWQEGLQACLQQF